MHLVKQAQRTMSGRTTTRAPGIARSNPWVISFVVTLPKSRGELIEAFAPGLRDSPTP
jgi:hypothetical protein